MQRSPLIFFYCGAYSEPSKIQWNFFFNFVCNITFNRSNYVVVGVVAESLFSAYILRVLKVHVSYDLRHLELASPISEETLQTHCLRHLQYGMRNVFQSVRPSSFVISFFHCHTYLPLVPRCGHCVGHMLLMFCVHCDTRQLLRPTRNQVLTPYSQLSIVRYSPKHRERFPASRKFL